MNKNFFQQLRFALVAISMTILLTACGGDSSSETPEDQTEASTASDSSNLATESRYRAIAGEWRGRFVNTDGNQPETKEYRFTIDLNGVGFWQEDFFDLNLNGNLLHVINYVPSGDSIIFKIGCRTSPNDCADLTLFAQLNANSTRMESGSVTSGGFGASINFEAVKIR